MLASIGCSESVSADANGSDACVAFRTCHSATSGRMIIVGLMCSLHLVASGNLGGDHAKIARTSKIRMMFPNKA